MVKERPQVREDLKKLRRQLLLDQPSSTIYLKPNLYFEGLISGTMMLRTTGELPEALLRTTQETMV